MMAMILVLTQGSSNLYFYNWTGGGGSVTYLREISVVCQAVSVF